MSKDVNESDKHNIFQIFLNHPILILTILGLVMSSIGYAYQYVLLSKFNINFANYAELDDFLLGAWKVPSVSLYLLAIFVLIAVASIKYNERLKLTTQRLLELEEEI